MNSEDILPPLPHEQAPPADAGVGAPARADVEQVDAAMLSGSGDFAASAQQAGADTLPAAVSTSNGPAVKPLPTTLTAARDAAAFVAHIFAEPVDDNTGIAAASSGDELGVDATEKA